MKQLNKRGCGVLTPIFSLNGSYGIGTFGKQAYRFVDFLRKAHQSYWQILPLGPTGFGDSPYACFSSFAGNIYFIDLDELIDQGYLKKSEVRGIKWCTSETTIDYQCLFYHRKPILMKAAQRFLTTQSQEFTCFCEQNSAWLDDYATFMSLKEFHNNSAWNTWPKQYQDHTSDAVNEFKHQHAQAIKCHKVLQYFFFTQYNALKNYANANGIAIIGDIPIYVAYDSVDVWANKPLFDLDKNYQPNRVAGCPPDGFSADGQLWGNPLYRWDYHKQTHYAWWMQRIKASLALYDALRLDHFRGFAAYYSIDAKTLDAKNGVWVNGPGTDFFACVKETFPNATIIAEDLGYLDDNVKSLLDYCGYPGMKLLQFAFDTREPSHVLYYPYQYDKNCVAYTGTHDNSCINGWIHCLTKQDLTTCKKYLHIKRNDEVNEAMIATLLQSNANTAIVCIQDLLKLDDSARINTPNTIGTNWQWRLSGKDINAKLANRLKELTLLYHRD